MQAPREGPNPLRPYYVPPSIGITSEPAANATAGASRANEGTSSSFSFPDLDYSDYLSDASPSVTSSLKKFLDQAVWKYTNVLMAQPFEVAKLILQVNVAQDVDLNGTIGQAGDRGAWNSLQEEYGEENANSSDDEPNYFTSTTSFEPFTSGGSPTRGRRGRSPRHEASAQTDSFSNQLHLKNMHSLLDTLSSLSSTSGPLALWRGTNSTFIYAVLSKTFEAFFRSFLAAVIGLAETDVLIPVATGAIPNSSILSSASPGTTVLIATAAAALSALLLAPIDAARTRLILTPSSLEPRTLLGTLRSLSPSYLIPAHLIPITFLTSTLPTLISSSTPLFLKSYLHIDPSLNSTSWSVATFLGSALDLSVRFPLETVLRRAQIATWTSPTLSPPKSSSKRKAIETIVPVPQLYRGIVPTMWGIIHEEGYSESQKDKLAAAAGKAPRRKRRGQGVEGLYRGWRVGLWGLIGVWGAGFIGGLQLGGETPAETPGTRGGKF
jgi:mitochondrial fusion and transport protein UGO1